LADTDQSYLRLLLLGLRELRLLPRMGLSLLRLRDLESDRRESEPESELELELESESGSELSESDELFEPEDDLEDDRPLLCEDSPSFSSSARSFSLASNMRFAVPLFFLNSSGTSTDGLPSALSFASTRGFSSICVREGRETYGREDLHSYVKWPVPRHFWHTVEAVARGWLAERR